MARRAEQPEPFRFVKIGQEIVETGALTPSAITKVRAAERDGKVHCPTCGGRMTLLMDPDGPVAVHRAPNPYAGHEPEDPDMRRAKRMTAQRLRALFPSAPPELDVHIPEIDHLADVVVLTPYGGRMAVEVQQHDMTAAQVAGLVERYESIGIRCLWLLDGRRLRLSNIRTGEGQVFRAMIEPLETALLAAGEPLIYLKTSTQEVAWVRPNPAVRELALLGDRRIGRVEALVRTYPLAQLRVKQGRWSLQTNLDKRPPRPSPLPGNLVKRLEKLRAKRDAQF